MNRGNKTSTVVIIVLTNGSWKTIVISSLLYKRKNHSNDTHTNTYIFILHIYSITYYISPLIYWWPTPLIVFLIIVNETAMNKWVQISIVGYGLKENTEKWMDLECIILNKIRQSQIKVNHNSLISRISK